jgi:hypothetical protein
MSAPYFDSEFSLLDIEGNDRMVEQMAYFTRSRTGASLLNRRNQTIHHFVPTQSRSGFFDTHDYQVTWWHTFPISQILREYHEKANFEEVYGRSWFEFARAVQMVSLSLKQILPLTKEQFDLFLRQDQLHKAPLAHFNNEWAADREPIYEDQASSSNISIPGSFDQFEMDDSHQSYEGLQTPNHFDENTLHIGHHFLDDFPTPIPSSSTQMPFDGSTGTEVDLTDSTWELDDPLQASTETVMNSSVLQIPHLPSTGSLYSDS